MCTGLVKASITKNILAFYSLLTTRGRLPDGELFVYVGVGWTVQCICTETWIWGVLLSQYVNLEHFLAASYVSKEREPFWTFDIYLLTLHIRVKTLPKHGILYSEPAMQF